MFDILIKDNEFIKENFSGRNLETQIKSQFLFKLYIFGIFLLVFLSMAYAFVSPEKLYFILTGLYSIILIVAISILPLRFGHYNLSISIITVLFLCSNFVRNVFPGFLEPSSLSLTGSTARLMLLILFVILFSNNLRLIILTFVSSFSLLLYYSDLKFQTLVHSELKICLGLISGSFLIASFTRLINSKTIRKLKKYQESLKQNEIKFRNLVESSSDWIWEVNADGAYTYTSPTVKEILGYESEEILGKRPFNFVPPKETLQYSDVLKDKIEKAIPIKALENINLHKNGHQIIIETSGVPVFNSTGEYIGYRGIGRDVTERKKIVKELKTARVKAEEALQVKSDFLSNMSHEIRTPMNSVLGFIDLSLKDKTLLEPAQNYLTIAKTAANNLLALLDEILDINKLDSGKLIFENHPFSLFRLIGGVQSITDKKAWEKGIQLSYEIQPSLSESFIGDSFRLRQIMTHLIDNAIKFTQKGSIFVRIMSAEKKDQLHFSIKDTGIGIPADWLNKIFEPFTQVDSSMTREFSGAGLGLAISKKLIEMMGGKIWVQSRKGQGSDFHFTINLPSTDKLPENNNSYTITDKSTFSKFRKGFRILLVEDNKMNVALSLIRLKDQGHKTKVAWNGYEAIEAISKEKIDIILMDLHMPKMDGIEATKRIRKLETITGKRIPIIVMTADEIKESNDKYFKIGIDAFVNKPIDFNKLFEVLENFVPKGIGKVSSDSLDMVSQSKAAHYKWETPEKKEVSQLKILFKNMLMAFDQFNPYDLKPFLSELINYVPPNQLDPIIGYLKRFDFENAKRATVKLAKNLKIDYGG